MHATVVVTVLLEVGNACQCFALQALLAGVVDDTPVQLVEWKGKLRASRSAIDAFVFVVRMGLWVGYNAVSSVFLVKNLYNILHGISMVERAAGVRAYPPRETLFFGYVPANEW